MSKFYYKLTLTKCVLKKSKPILRTIGSVGGSDPFGPACQQAGWTISSFSNSPVANWSALPSLAANSFLILFRYNPYF